MVSHLKQKRHVALIDADFANTDSTALPPKEAYLHRGETTGILCLARTKAGKMTDKRRQIRLTESVSCAG